MHDSPYFIWNCSSYYFGFVQVKDGHRFHVATCVLLQTLGRLYTTHLILAQPLLSDSVAAWRGKWPPVFSPGFLQDPTGDLELVINSSNSFLSSCTVTFLLCYAENHWWKDEAACVWRWGWGGMTWDMKHAYFKCSSEWHCCVFSWLLWAWWVGVAAPIHTEWCFWLVQWTLLSSTEKDTRCQESAQTFCSVTERVKMKENRVCWCFLFF